MKRGAVLGRRRGDFSAACLQRNSRAGASVDQSSSRFSTPFGRASRVPGQLTRHEPNWRRRSIGADRRAMVLLLCSLPYFRNGATVVTTW
jgi:hypothetical protein